MLRSTGKMIKGAVDVTIPSTRRTFCTEKSDQTEKMKVAFDTGKIKLAVHGVVDNFVTQQVRTAGYTVTACLAFKELYSFVKGVIVKDSEKSREIDEARFQAVLQLGRQAVGEISGLRGEISSLKEQVVEVLKGDKVVIVLHEAQRK